MRRLVLMVAGTLALGGCGTLGGNADVAAEAGGQTLRAEQLAGILGQVQGQRPEVELADFVANLWVSLTLASQAIANDGIPTDSAAVAEALWFDVAQARISAWHDTLMRTRINVSDEAIRDFYENGEARVFQHILVVPQGTAAADTARAQATVRQIQQGLAAGRSFADFAEQHNPDATRQDGGFLPPTPRGGFVQPFDSVAWTLSPGQTSGVVQTQFGWHFIRRPPLTEAGPRLADAISQDARRQADSAYSAELIEGKGITVPRSAPSVMRTVLSDLSKAGSNTRTVATWRGGEMPASEFARWVGMLPPGFPQRLQAESDSSLIGFARLLAQNMVMLEQADSARIPMPSVNWQAMQLTYRVSVDQLASELGLNAPEFDRAATTAAQRNQLAADRVNQYIEALATGQAQNRQILPGMAAMLRDQAPNRVNPAGVARAVALAMPKWVADSTAAMGGAGGGIPPGAVVPAPGGAPLPGGGE